MSTTAQTSDTIVQPGFLIVFEFTTYSTSTEAVVPKEKRKRADVIEFVGDGSGDVVDGIQRPGIHSNHCCWIPLLMTLLPKSD